MGGGWSNPIFAHGKCVFFHFFPWGKKYMEREGNEYFSLSFHNGKMGKHTFFHGQKWDWTPPPKLSYIPPTNGRGPYMDLVMTKLSNYT